MRIQGCATDGTVSSHLLVHPDYKYLMFGGRILPINHNKIVLYYLRKDVRIQGLLQENTVRKLCIESLDSKYDNCL